MDAKIQRTDAAPTGALRRRVPNSNSADAKLPSSDAALTERQKRRMNTSEDAPRSLFCPEVFANFHPHYFIHVQLFTIVTNQLAHSN